MKTFKAVRRAFVVALLVYLVWLAAQIVGFRRYGLPAGSPALDAETAGALKEHEMEGVYHVHSRFSDGRRAVGSIAAIAASAGLDFIILTDHGNPNRPSLAAQGRTNGVLVLAGTEISTNRGHLAALGFEVTERDFSQNAEIAALEIARSGGISIIAHPYSKTHWSWGLWEGYSGIEVFNGDTAVRRRLVRVIAALPLLGLRPEAALLPLLDPPTAEMAKWDRLSENGPVAAFFAADAHFGYRSIFTLFHLHVLLETPPAADFETVRRQIFGALKNGRFYNAVEAAASARGFRFWAERAGTIVPMGGIVRPEAAGPDRIKFVVLAPFPFAHETRLLRNGREVVRSNGPELVHETDERGVYRVEVFLRERTPLNGRVPWIVSNPISLEKTRP